MYPCKRCGCCCRHVGRFFLGRALALPDGSCRYWDRETHLCRIYETRPWFCRIDETYENYLSSKMSREDFYRKNQRICQRLREEEIKNGGFPVQTR